VQWRILVDAVCSAAEWWDYWSKILCMKKITNLNTRWSKYDRDWFFF
jgi:hypothetical protein